VRFCSCTPFDARQDRRLPILGVSHKKPESLHSLIIIVILGNMMMNDPGESVWLPPTRQLLRNATNAGEDTTPCTTSSSNQNLGAFVFLIAGSACFMLLFVIFYREYYWRKHGVDTCSGYGCSRSRRQPTHLEDSDRAGEADELERRRMEEQRDAERIVKRNERQRWYESYLKAFSMVSSKHRE
jgi:hypothetical protein